MSKEGDGDGDRASSDSCCNYEKGASISSPRSSSCRLHCRALMENIEFHSVSENADVEMIHEEEENSADNDDGCEETYVCQSCKRTGSDYLDVITPYTTDSRQFGTNNLKKRKWGCSLCQDVKQFRSSNFDPMVAREKFVIAIVIHGLPFSLVEGESFRELTDYLNPNVEHISVDTAIAEMLRMYNREKMRLKATLRSVRGRICLTASSWTSIIDDDYMIVTVHFVDEAWNLQSKIIQFCRLPPPDIGLDLSDKMLSFLNEWGIEKKIFSLTIDNASNTNNMQQCMERQMKVDNLLLCDGKYFNVRCCAHILNAIIQEGLKVVDSWLQKIRDSVRYIRGSESRRIIFQKCVDEMEIETSMGLRIDFPPRWDTTFAMFESVLVYRKAFKQFGFLDDGFKCFPSEEEWDRGQRMTNFLRPFAEFSTLLSGKEYVTSNLYFLHVSRIQFKLLEEIDSPDEVIKDMATQMKVNFDKYWDECGSVLAFSLTLDPRYKLSFIEYCYNKLDPSTSKAKLACVRKELYELFDEYSKLITTQESRSTENFHGSTSDGKAAIKYPDWDFEEFCAEAQQSHGFKSELDIYLEDLRYRVRQYPDLDVLAYWKNQKYRYPILSLMARDILSIPLTTVDSESAFSMRNLYLSKYRSVVLPSYFEGLVCLQNWLSGFEGPELEDEEELELQFSNRCNVQAEPNKQG